MEKRLIIAIALSIFVIVLFQSILPGPKKTAQPQIRPVTQKDADKIAFTSPVTKKAEEKEEKIFIETVKYTLTFSTLGGSLKDAKLKEYRDPKTGGPLQLVSEKEGGENPFSIKSNIFREPIDRQNFTVTKREKNSTAFN